MKQTASDYKKAAIFELKRRAARAGFAPFVLFTTPGYKMGWVHREICETLEQFLQDVRDRKSPRLMISMPPRSGKSELVSRKFPAYAFGIDPDLQIIATSYGADMAQRFNRDVQRVIDNDLYHAAFPETTLNASNVRTTSKGAYIRTSDLFEIVGHSGSYRSCGVGGGITGMGADILIIDDPVKDRKSANSATVRQSIYEWYTSTAYTRLSPGGGVIVMCTRWHVDDLLGMLLKEEQNGGDKWHVINYPAIAEHDEPHRKAGEALHPERYPLDSLLKIKGAVGSADWASLYQGRPTVLGGNIIKSSWFKRYKQLPDLKYRLIDSDTALKTKEANDFSVFGCGGLGKDGKLYIVDWRRGKWESPDLKRNAVDFWEKHKIPSKNYGACREFYVEDKASGTGLIQELKRGPYSIPIMGIERGVDKLTRLQDVLGQIEAGNVYLPENAPWVSDFIAECEAFRGDMKHAHDDQVDVLVDLINLTLGVPKTPWAAIFTN